MSRVEHAEHASFSITALYLVHTACRHSVMNILQLRMRMQHTTAKGVFLLA